MFCSFCGTQLEDGAQFCHHCGASVQQTPVQQTSAQPPQKKATKSRAKKSYRENLSEAIKASAEERHREEEASYRSNRGCGIAVIILIIAIALLAIFA